MIQINSLPVAALDVPGFELMLFVTSDTTGHHPGRWEMMTHTCHDDASKDIRSWPLASLVPTAVSVSLYMVWELDWFQPRAEL